jgi:protoporphyrinogen IX oxidase
MLWIKSLHIVFVIAWFAGLFYLPRILVNLAMLGDGSNGNNGDTATRARLLLMAS